MKHAHTFKATIASTAMAFGAVAPAQSGSDAPTLSELKTMSVSTINVTPPQPGDAYDPVNTKMEYLLSACENIYSIDYDEEGMVTGSTTHCYLPAYDPEEKNPTLYYVDAYTPQEFARPLRYSEMAVPPEAGPDYKIPHREFTPQSRYLSAEEYIYGIVFVALSDEFRTGDPDDNLFFQYEGGDLPPFTRLQAKHALAQLDVRVDLATEQYERIQTFLQRSNALLGFIEQTRTGGEDLDAASLDQDLMEEAFGLVCDHIMIGQGNFGDVTREVLRNYIEQRAREIYQREDFDDTYNKTIRQLSSAVFYGGDDMRDVAAHRVIGYFNDLIAEGEEPGYGEQLLRRVIREALADSRMADALVAEYVPNMVFMSEEELANDLYDKIGMSARLDILDDAAVAYVLRFKSKGVDAAEDVRIDAGNLATYLYRAFFTAHETPEERLAMIRKYDQPGSTPFNVEDISEQAEYYSKLKAVYEQYLEDWDTYGAKIESVLAERGYDPMTLRTEQEADPEWWKALRGPNTKMELQFIPEGP